MPELPNTLRDLMARAGHWTEIRYHNRRSRAVSVRKGELVEMSSKHHGGVGIRVLIDGTWGFAASSDLTPTGLERTLREAEGMARALSSVKKRRVDIATPESMARGEFLIPGYAELDAMPLEDKLEQVRRSEAQVRDASEKIEAAQCYYSEVFEDKHILTSDGADALIKLARPEIRVIAFGADGSQRTNGYDSAGGTGEWTCLFRNRDLNEMVDQAAANAVDLLTAPEAPGGKTRVILSPAMVGMLSHEAIGHTVEADFVSAGSVAEGKIGQMVASPLITMCDSGRSEHTDGAGGMIPVDDEGVPAERTVIIQDGKLVSYLHNRESAAEYGVAPTGNARAWEFADEPLIRMRNTYIEPGQDELADMIAGIENGYFIEGPESGQADATAEFMFGADKVRRITGGKLGEFVQKMTVSGNAIEVLQSVDAVSRDFRWDMGAGYCGKGQPAKVDAGGPYLRCELMIGGAQ
jgi:TldD protein